PDLVVTNQPTNPTNPDTVVALGQADGTFQASATLPISVPVVDNRDTAVVGDFNGDGRPDLLFSIDIASVPSRQDQKLFGFFGNGAGPFRAAPATTLKGFGTVRNMPLAAGDFDGDGVTDLIVADATGGAWFLHGNGDGTFRANGDGTFGVLLF